MRCSLGEPLSPRVWRPSSPNRHAAASRTKVMSNQPPNSSAPGSLPPNVNMTHHTQPQQSQANPQAHGDSSATVSRSSASHDGAPHDPVFRQSSSGQSDGKLSMLFSICFAKMFNCKDVQNALFSVPAVLASTSNYSISTSMLLYISSGVGLRNHETEFRRHRAVKQQTLKMCRLSELTGR